MISKGELCNRGPEKDVLHAFTYRTRGGGGHLALHCAFKLSHSLSAPATRLVARRAKRIMKSLILQK